MMVILLIIALLNVTTTLVQGYSYSVTGAVLVGASSKNSEGLVLKKLSTGHFIVGGQSTGSIGSETNAGSGSTYDMVIQKYDSSKTLVWTRMVGGSSNDYIYDIAIDSSDNIYVAGSCTGTVDSQTNAGSLDMCIVKYNSDGTKQWTKLFGASLDDEAYGIAVDSAGTYLYIVGYTKSSSFYGTSRTGSVSSVWMKVDTATGTRQSSLFINNLGINYAYGIALDTSDNGYIVGSTSSSSYNGLASIGTYDAVLSKFDTSGSGVWHKRVGSTGNDEYFKVVLDSSNNVYACGYSVAGSSFGGVSYYGSRDGIVQAYTSSGTLTFSQVVGGTLNDEIYACDVDSTNSLLYLTGYTKSTFYGDSSSTTANYGSTFIALLDTATGSVQYTNVLASASSDTGNAILVASSSPYIVGKTTGAYSGVSVTGSLDMSFLSLGTAGSPSTAPTAAPSVAPGSPTTAPTASPTTTPTKAPTATPTIVPTASPTATPSLMPTVSPTLSPTLVPTVIPSRKPTASPSFKPTPQPSSIPTLSPTEEPPMDSFVVLDIVFGGVFLIMFILYCWWTGCAVPKQGPQYVSPDHCFKGPKSVETTSA